MAHFVLDEADHVKLAEWRKQQNIKAITQQQERIKEEHPKYATYRRAWESGVPYGGAIGGSLTYQFIPTTVNCIVTVINSTTGDKLDLTDPDW